MMHLSDAPSHKKWNKFLKFWRKVEKNHFLILILRLFNINNFLKNPALSLFYIPCILNSCKILEKSKDWHTD